MLKQELEGLTYCCLTSSEINREQIYDYLDVINRVFESDRTETDFKKKFIDNIYGDSVIILVYDSSRAIAARALWRNDLRGKTAYQPCDTAVDNSFRGKGIFKIMTDMALETIPEAVIYNYPNNNSRKLYLRNGWTVKNKYFLNLFLSDAGYMKNNGDVIDDDYYFWWFSGRKDVFKIKFGKNNYLLRKRKNGIYIIIGKISDRVFEEKELKRPGVGVIFYRSLKKSFYTSSVVYSVVTDNFKNTDIPLYKMDAI